MNRIMTTLEQLNRMSRTDLIAIVERVGLLPELLGDMANERTAGPAGKRQHEKGVATGLRYASAYIRGALLPEEPK